MLLQLPAEVVGSRQSLPLPVREKECVTLKTYLLLHFCHIFSFLTHHLMHFPAFKNHNLTEDDCRVFLETTQVMRNRETDHTDQIKNTWGRKKGS